ncbi:MAG: ABC transporter substrate-binding protein [Chloroflexota bacterium]
MSKRIAFTLTTLLVLLGLLAACAPAAPAGDAMDAGDDGLVSVTYTYAGRGVPADLQAVQDAMNEIINEYGVDLTLEPIDFGAYNDKMQLRLAAGEECDIIFTAPWINSYANNVANGALMALDDLLIENASGLWDSMPPTTWDAARVNGTIYGVINQQIFPKPWGVHPRADLMEKYGFTLDTVTKWEDMEPFMEAVRDGEGITPIYADERGGSSMWRAQYYGYDPLDDGIGFAIMMADDETLTVVNTLETSEFREAVELSKKWVDAGYFPSELAPADEARAAFRAGLFGMGYHVEKPGNDVEAEAAHGWPFLSKNLTNPLILDTAGATATMNAICSTSPNPAEAMTVLELINTNAEVYNLLSRGIEGTHWVWVDEANQVMAMPEGVTTETSSYAPNTDWMFGNQFNAYYRDAKQVGAWEATKAMNDGALPSQALGFVVDREPIKTELAQTQAVWDELVKPIMNGWVAYDDGAVEAIEKLNDAGAQTVIEEIQRQLIDWKAANSR